jgi:hypothetical protein
LGEEHSAMTNCLTASFVDARQCHRGERWNLEFQFAVKRGGFAA